MALTAIQVTKAVKPGRYCFSNQGDKMSASGLAFGPRRSGDHQMIIWAKEEQQHYPERTGIRLRLER
jgi:hypothetical protein